MDSHFFSRARIHATHSSHILFLAGTLAYLAVRVFFMRKLAAREKSVRKTTRTDTLLVALVGCGQIGIPILAMATPLLAFANKLSTSAASTRPTCYAAEASFRSGVPNAEAIGTSRLERCRRWREADHLPRSV
jgi:hypothetical protein